MRNYLGLAFIPQAGVSIGLAMLGQRILPADAGALPSTIILSSGILYEMVGPICTNFPLFLSHSIDMGPKKKLKSTAQAVSDLPVEHAPQH